MPVTRATRPPRRGGAGTTVRSTLAVAVAATLSSCTSAVPVDVAPFASDPVCAEVVLALPDELGEGLPALDTTAQATKAWGTPADPVVLRCGVEPLGPTTDRCVTVETPDGPSVDWVVVADEAMTDATETGWTFTTYGREPAVEVYVPAAVAGERSTSFVDLLGPAVSRTEQLRTCL